MLGYTFKLQAVGLFMTKKQSNFELFDQIILMQKQEK